MVSSFPRLGFTTPTQKLNHYYLRKGWSYRLQIWLLHSQGPSEQKPIKDFAEKVASACPGTAQFFKVPPIISRTDKASNFKFCTHIRGIDRNKSPLKISGKFAVGELRDSRKCTVDVRVDGDKLWRGWWRRRIITEGSLLRLHHWTSC